MRLQKKQTIARVRPKGGGAVTHFRIGLCALTVLLGAVAPAHAADAQRIDLAGGYSLLHLNDNAGIFPVGWSGSVTVNVRDWLGVVSEVSGDYKSYGNVEPQVPGDWRGHYETFLAGFKLTNSHQQVLPLIGREPDEELWLVERVMRIFLRANQVNEDVIRMKLGVRASQFFDDVLPKLLRAGMFEVIPYLGSGNQRRFKMRVQVQKLHHALADCGGEFERFWAWSRRRRGLQLPPPPLAERIGASRV